MIFGITSVTDGQLAVWGLEVVGLFLLGYLGKIFIDEWRDHMRRHSRPELLDEYADDVPNQPYADMEGLADSLRGYPDLDEDQVADEDTGRHSLAMVVPPPTAMEATGWMPVVSGGDGAA